MKTENKEEVRKAEGTKIRHKGKWIPRRTDLGPHAWVDWFCDQCGYVRKGGWEGSHDGEKPDAKFCKRCGALIGR